MWICDTCCEGHTESLGMRAAQFALEGHLRDTGHATGLYSYGGRTADNVVVKVERLPDGFNHDVVTL
jgi:hypothetical protein